MRIRQVGLIGIVILLFVSIGWSHTYSPYRTFRTEWYSIKETAPWRIGPFYLRPEIRLREIGYDANVYREREQDDPVTDYTFTFSPQITAYWLLGHSVILSFQENPEYVYYFEQTQERRWNNSFSPQLRWMILNRFVLGGKYDYQNRRYRFSSEVDVRVNELNKTYEGSLFYETPRETSLGFRYTRSDISYNDIDVPGAEFPLSERLSREEEEISGEFYYLLLPDSFFFIRGGLTRYRFAYEESSFRDADSRQIYTGLQFPFMGDFRGALSLGYKNFVPLSEDRDSFSGLVGEADLEYRMRKLRLRTGYRRDNRFSFYGGSTYFIENQLRGGVSVYLTRSLRLDYDYRYGMNDYPEGLWTVGGESILIERQDIYQTHTAGIAVRLLRDIGIGINYNYWTRDTNAGYGVREWWFVGGSLVYDF